MNLVIFKRQTNSFRLQSDATLKDLSFIRTALQELKWAKTLDALSDFEASLSHDPNNYRCLLEAGRISIDLQEIDNAIEFFEKALKITKDNESAIVGLSYSLSLRGLKKL